MDASSRRRLSPAELRRLQLALGRDAVDPAANLFGPDSPTWRINREGVILLGGGCALLMQVAHPLVAAGVGAHSRYRDEPLQRLWRTLELMLTIVFASAADAVRAACAIDRAHARVHGRLAESAGPFARGTPYRANDPELQLWVHATLVDTAVRVYELFLAPLPQQIKAAYYEESKVTGRLLGIPDSVLPRDWRAFRAYIRRMIESDVLAVSAASRDIAASVFVPSLSVGVRQVFQIPNFVTVGLLPEPLRRRYGYRWSAGRDLAVSTAATMSQLVMPWLPDLLRVIPRARRVAA